MMQKMIVKIESWEEMLSWDEELAHMIDRGEKIPESCIRSFEDPEDLLALFTPSRRELLAEILRGSGSVDELSVRVQRNILDVDEDVHRLVDADIVTFEQCMVHPIAETIEFELVPQFTPEA